MAVTITLFLNFEVYCLGEKIDSHYYCKSILPKYANMICKNKEGLFGKHHKKLFYLITLFTIDQLAYHF